MNVYRIINNITILIYFYQRWIMTQHTEIINYALTAAVCVGPSGSFK